MDELRREAAGAGTTGTPRATGPRIFGLTAPVLRVLGIVLLGLGLLIAVGGFLLWVTFTPPSIFTTDFQTVESATSAAFARTVLMGFAGFVLAAIGIAALWFGMIRPVTTFVASEVSPAIGVVAQSAAQGVSMGLGASQGVPVRIVGAPATAATVVRLKCRSCGYLDSEDATYCSKCGKPL